jgi:DNA segregation ATPase FtsK/SpoIIIE-like protein
MKRASRRFEEEETIRIERVYIRRRRITGAAIDYAPPVEPRTIEGGMRPRRPAASLPPPPDLFTNKPPVDLCAMLDAMEDVQPMTAVLGKTGPDGDGDPLLLRLDAPDVGNVLISGEAGAGKATLMRTILLSLALTNPRAGLQIALIDTQGRVLSALDNLPHRIAPLAIQPAEAYRLLDWLAHEGCARQQQTPRAPVVLAVNAPGDLARAAGPRAFDHLTNLAKSSRAAAIYVLCAEPRPERLPAGLLDAFKVRLVGRAVDKKAAELAAGRPGTGAEKLKGGGDFLAVAGGEVVNFHAAACRAADAARRISALQTGALPGRDNDRRLLPPS